MILKYSDREYRDRYKGKFDMGWDAAREQILSNQIARGIMAAGTKLAPRASDIPAWDSLTPEQKRMYARQMEAFAGQMEHVDQEIGRIIAALERTGMLENTLILLTSDNAASGEGGLEGSHNEVLLVNGVGRTPFEVNQKFYDTWGSAETNNHYHAGWAMAGNTPFKYFKQTSHNGGNADPLIVHPFDKLRARPIGRRNPGAAAGARSGTRLRRLGCYISVELPILSRTKGAAR